MGSEFRPIGFVDVQIPPAPGALGHVDDISLLLAASGAILAIAFVMVALFALNQLVLKISLWTAFGLSIVGGLFGLLAALLKTTTFGITEGGAWGACAVQFAGERVVKHLVHERTLARPAHARDRDERTERDVDIDVPQVVLPCADDRQDLTVRGA